MTDTNVLTGERSFSAGSDVKAFESHTGAAGRPHFTREEAVSKWQHLCMWPYGRDVNDPC